MNIFISIVFILILIKLLIDFINRKPKEKTWKNKPYNEELTYDEKRLLILRINEPRTITTGYGWSRNQQDIIFYSVLDRFTLSVAFGSIQNGESIPLSGEMVSATPEVIKSSSKNAKSLYSRIKEEYKIDLIKLAQKDYIGADLSKDPLL